MTAYWIAHVTVTDPIAYRGYQERAAAVFRDHGAEFLARGGASETLEGAGFERHVVIRFPSLAAARACYYSSGYAEARRHRDGAAVVQVVLVEGVPEGR